VGREFKLNFPNVFQPPPPPATIEKLTGTKRKEESPALRMKRAKSLIRIRESKSYIAICYE
jgi:hypothetical protein